MINKISFKTTSYSRSNKDDKIYKSEAQYITWTDNQTLTNKHYLDF